MMKAVFFLFLSFLVGDEVFSSTLVLGHDEYGFSQGLCRRHCEGVSEPEKTSLLSKDIQGSVIEEVHTSPSVQEIDEEEIFSDLGDVWTAFKEGNRAVYRKELVRLGRMSDEPDPKALYLLGKICKSFYKSIIYYTNALTNSEEGSTIYNLALKAILECQKEALRRAKERDL